MYIKLCAVYFVPIWLNLRLPYWLEDYLIFPPSSAGFYRESWGHPKLSFNQLSPKAV